MREVDAVRPIPIFPLPGVQLFPHALLPLHVFEPRYRELVRDAAIGDKLIAPATLIPGYEPEYHGRPRVRPIVGVGRMIAHDPLPDGRSNVLLRGVGRARIVEELPPERSYRLVRVELLEDEPGNAAVLSTGQATLTMLVDRLARMLPSGGDTLRELLHEPRDAGALTDVIAAALLTDAGLRQELLETLDVERRLELVTAEVSALLTRFATHDGPAN